MKISTIVVQNGNLVFPPMIVLPLNKLCAYPEVRSISFIQFLRLIPKGYPRLHSFTQNNYICYVLNCFPPTLVFHMLKS